MVLIAISIFDDKNNFHWIILIIALDVEDVALTRHNEMLDWQCIY